MATTGASTRISRLRPREPTVRAVPEKKLKPRKVAATNRSSKKVNVSLRGRSLRVSKENASLRNSQTPAISRLRPRRNRKNYCEDSRLLQRYISPKQQDSVVVVEKLNLQEGGKKLPVYKKPVEPSEKSSEDKNDVYDFKFDINDSREKATKKKKQGRKNIDKGKGKIIKKTTRKKVTARSKIIDREVIKPPESDANLSMGIAQSNRSKLSRAVESIKDVAKKIETLKIKTNIQMLEESVNEYTGEEVEPPRIDADVQTMEKSTENIVEMETLKTDKNVQAVGETTLPDETFARQIRRESTSKPRIISIENANNIVVNKTPPNDTDDSRPFRPKNIFDNKTLKEHNGSALKYSLLTKTLSPIAKTASNFDLGSPWRPPTLTFSQTKHFIQSTPYKNSETNKENKEKKRSMEMDKENMDVNKENKSQKDLERKKKQIGLRKKRVIQRKLPISENQAPEKVRAAAVSKSVRPAPARISLGEIKNLQRPKQTVDQTHTEIDKPLGEQKNKQMVDFLNFSDTFDILSETERLSNIGNNAPLFMDLEPTHFSKPPQHSYRRKRTVKFVDFSEPSEDEEEKENVKTNTKKKKLTKTEKEQEKRINDWIKTVNTTFQEIEEHDLVIE
ncbi:uncharacterized protein LOC143900452 [Temnothorax americanus]|uniref:uncharacterized protein LOC143900452 n=1 Tax=Temnothorax americanus TaxID=1964332 RepID=UPI0040692C31